MMLPQCQWIPLIFVPVSLEVTPTKLVSEQALPSGPANFTVEIRLRVNRFSIFVNIHVVSHLRSRNLIMFKSLK